MDQGVSTPPLPPSLILREPFSGFKGYCFALAAVIVALCFALVAQHLSFGNVELPLFLFAVALTAWYTMVGPTAVALLLAVASFNYFFTDPRYTFYVTLSELPYFIVFMAFAVLTAWFSAVRRRVERQLIDAHTQLQAEVIERTQQANLLNLTHDTIFVRDMQDVIKYWNRGAQELYGWAPEDAIGKRSHELLRTTFPAPIADISAGLLRTGRWEGELKHIRSDGTEVVVSSRWSLQRDGHDQPLAILETNNDITDRKRRELEIEQLNLELAKRSSELEGTNKELEAFAYSVSHDLRAPLRHMSGFTELLQKRAASTFDEKSQRYTTVILDSARKMGNLIDDLLAFSRIGRAEAKNTVINLQQLANEAVKEVSLETSGRVIAWKIGALPDSYGDRSMLRLAFVNLLSNAAKFTKTRQRAEIEIGCESGNERELVVFVRDNGVGFDMRYVNKLFGVFQRLHRAEAFEGTGIGLATVQRIIHRHGGKVWAEGTVDSGATFYFSVPRS